MILRGAHDFLAVIAILMALIGVITILVGIAAAMEARNRPWERKAPSRKKPKKIRPALQETITFDLLLFAAVLSGPQRSFRQDEWGADLHDARIKIRYALSLVKAGLAFRLMDLGRSLWHAARWILAGEVRTWLPLTGLLVWCGFAVRESAGLPAAILSVIGAAGACNGLVQTLRARWSVRVGREKDATRP